MTRGKLLYSYLLVLLCSDVELFGTKGLRLYTDRRTNNQTRGVFFRVFFLSVFFLSAYSSLFLLIPPLFQNSMTEPKTRTITSSLSHSLSNELGSGGKALLRLIRDYARVRSTVTIGRVMWPVH
jgi:hypothetical protein